MLDSDDDRAKIAYTLSVARLEREVSRLNNDEALKTFVTEFYASSSSHRQIWVLETLKLQETSSQWKKDLLSEMCTTSKVQEIRERGYKVLNALQSNEPWVVELLKAWIAKSLF